MGEGEQRSGASMGDCLGRPGTRLDIAALLLIGALLVAPCVMRLGFYSDDWDIILTLSRSEFGEPFRYFAARPMQALYAALTYAALGAHPLGHHLALAALLILSFPLLYLLMLRLGADRRQAFAAAALFAVLPQLSTIRVWIAAAAVPLSMVFALLSIHCQLTFARSRAVGSAALALLFAVLSIAAYETFAPLIFAFALWLAWSRPDHRSWKAVALVLGVLALAILLKLAITDRAGAVADIGRYLKGLQQLFRTDYDWRVDGGLNIKAALDVHFVQTLAGWVKAASALLSGELAALPLLAVLGPSALALWRLHASDAPSTGMAPGRLFLVGLAAFVLGHAAFLIVPSIIFSPTGLANRALVPAAMGVALISTAAFSWLGGRIYPFAVAALVLLGAARTAQITEYWAEAPARQHRILAAARTDLRSVPEGSTVVLDGVCPYVGPAPVFETWWDVGPSLTLALGRTVRGDIVTDRMTVTSSGLVTAIYREPTVHRFGARLFFYDPRVPMLVQVRDEATAREYFRLRAGTAPRCPQSFVGHGVLI